MSEKLHEELKRRREALGMTQTELAGRLTINLRTIQRWEAGEGPKHEPMWAAWRNVIREAEEVAEVEKRQAEEKAS